MTPNPEFEDWLRTLPSMYWTHSELGACRLGWEAAVASTKKKSSDALHELNTRLASVAKQFLETGDPTDKARAEVVLAICEGFGDEPLSHVNTATESDTR
jgi:hypothetical protein